MPSTIAVPEPATPVPAPAAASNTRALWAMLLARPAMALAGQVIVTFGFLAAGASDPIRSAADWWLGWFTIANLVNLALLARLARAEGKRLRDLYSLSRKAIGKDLLWLLVAVVVSGPVAFAPNLLLGNALFGSAEIPAQMSFRALPVWGAIAILVAFPISQGLAELPTYFGYVMPRLQALSGRRWMPMLVCGLVLSTQHVFLPMLPDWRFIVWRLFMFLPFAMWIGFVLLRRPTVMPYMVVVHALLDASLPVIILQASIAAAR